MSSSYANDIASPEVEIAGEAGGNFFADSKSRHADLKAMLDSNKDNLKMDAMKRIINMVAKGKDASDLFPAVVKNVAAKNLELKKLVYVYLVRYAEEQQDLALLSISTFQRALKDPNQLIRASALRVLSSIRVAMIAPIMMLSIKESMRDMSPYVRKVAGHAIPKLYSLDPEQKEQLIEVIDHLLADKATLVVGSAVYAFEELCPDRTDLIHKHYRKLCQILVDVDEWGQVIIINMLTRYARSQFADPNEGEEEAQELEAKFYSSTEGDSEEESEEEDEKKKKAAAPARKPYVMDPDLRILLKNTKPLLQSRNGAVVLAVAQLYYHLAPKNEIGIIAKSMIRLLRSHREVQSVVLSNIATISAKRRNMFEPFLKSFFVRSSDPTHIKLLKLEILTNLATQTNISIILREFQAYVQMHEKEFAAATIDAIGRCAANITEVTDVCLSGLVNLMSNKSETVVAQSVVVIKRLLQLQPAAYKDIIVQMAKLIDTVRVPAARASIVWLIGEYCQTVPQIAPDVLRKMAKSFIHEEETVKLQVVNLSVKLYLTNLEQTELLVQYVFNMAKYDQSYDLRDRTRFLKNLVMPEKPNQLTQFASKVFLTAKPAPLMESTFKDRDQFQLGTLSHYLNQRCQGYHDLPEFPENPPDGSVRNVEGWGLPSPSNEPKSIVEKVTGVSRKKKSEKFYSDEEESSEEEEESEDSGEESDETSSEEEDGESSEEVEDEESDEETEEDSEVESSEEESEEEVPKKPPPKKKEPEQPKKKAAEGKSKDVKRIAPASNTDLLLDLDFGSAPDMAPVMAMAQASTALEPTAAAKKKPTAPESYQTAPAQSIPSRTHELLNRMSGGGLEICFRYTRSPSIFSSKMVSIELQLTNHSQKAFESIRLNKKLASGMSISSGIPEAGISLGVGSSSTATIGVDFADTTQSATLEFVAVTEEGGDPRKFSLGIEPAVGEQLQPILMSPEQFKLEQGKLSGLNETSGKLKIKSGVSLENEKEVAGIIFDLANVALVAGTEDKMCFAGQTLSGKSLVLLSLAAAGSSDVKLVVNCEKMVIGSMLFKSLKKALSGE